MRDRSLEIKVGALILVAAALAAVFVFVLGNFSLSKGFRLSVDFNYSGNIQPGAPVKVSGIKVGKVEEVQFLGGAVDPLTGRHVQVRLKVWLEDRAQSAIHTDAAFFVNTAGVLGEQYLEITPGSYDKPSISPDAIVVGTDPPRTDLIVARLYEFLDSITGLLHDDKDLISRLLTSTTDVVVTVDQALKDNRQQIGGLVTDADALAREAAGLTAGLRRGVGDGATVSATLDNVDKLTGALAQQAGPLLDDAQGALAGVQRVTGLVGPEERANVDRALTSLASLSDHVDRITGDVAQVVAKIKNGQGTAGALLVDPELYDDIKDMIRDLKRNPWKFLWRQ